MIDPESYRAGLEAAAARVQLTAEIIRAVTSEDGTRTEPVQRLERALAEQAALIRALPVPEPAADAWQPMETCPEGEHVLLWLQNGEKGNGGIETATVFFDEPNWTYWTHGGTNAGDDFELIERPTMWQPCPAPPKAPDHD
jgi:hypothetical protein